MGGGGEIVQRKKTIHLREIASVFWREGSPRLLRMASCWAPGVPTMLNRKKLRKEQIQVEGSAMGAKEIIGRKRLRAGP